MQTLRSLPRCFVPGATALEPFELPAEELNKLRHVLRLASGSAIAVLPNDGSLIRCELQGKSANPIEVVWPLTESETKVTVAQALPKGDKLDDIVKACTAIGVSRFVCFPSERTVVKWDEKKRVDRLRRLSAIAREEAEVSFRTRLPEIEWADSLTAVLRRFPDSTVLSEVEGIDSKLERGGPDRTLVVGPEGGWAARELQLIGDRGVTLGPRVLRVEHAAAVAATLLLLG